MTTPTPVNIVGDETATDAAGNLVDVVPAVESIDPDAVEVEVTDRNELGNPVDPLPIRIVDGPATLASGALVDPLKVSIIGGGDTGDPSDSGDSGG